MKKWRNVQSTHCIRLNAERIDYEMEPWVKERGFCVTLYLFLKVGPYDQS